MARAQKKPKRSELVIRFIEEFCITPEGPQVGRPLVLLPFQKKFIRDVYDNPSGTRLGILSIARKNGKSALIAAIMLAHLVGPESRKNSQVISGGRSRDQAAIIYNLAWKMVAQSAHLRKLIHPIPSKKTLIGKPRNVEYRALAAEAGSTHGLSPALAIIDEMGQVKGEVDPFIEAIETAQGAYDDALELVISTQAPTDADMFSRRIDDAKNSGDPTIVCHVYSAPEEADLTDPKAWKAANPALGKFRSKIEISQKADEADRMSSVENSFRNLYLNQRVKRDAAFISPSLWKSATGPVADLRGTYCFAGLDLSKTTDLTAFVIIGFVDGKWNVHPYFWTPEDTLRERGQRDRANYEAWVRDGYMKATPGTSVDYSFVARDVMEIISPLSVEQINFDRWRMDELKREFGNIGAEPPLEPFGQGFVSMSPALEAVEREFLQGRVVHPGNPALNFCAMNSVVTTDAAENRKLDKSKSTGRIDGMVALAMAMAAAVQKEVEGDSIYEKRAALVF